MDGRLVQIGFLGGAKGQINMLPVLQRRLWITGSTLRARSDPRESRDRPRCSADVWPLLEAGTVRVLVHATFPLREAAEAHRMMESSAHIGKLVLTV